MKEYKVMVKAIKTGEWVRAGNTLKSEYQAAAYGKLFIEHEQKKKYPNYSEYKIMTRDVSKWEEI